MIITDKKALNIACEKVDTFEQGIEIIDILKSELENTNPLGIGLAANQIGINKQVFVMNIPVADEDYDLAYSFINPVVVERKNPIIFKSEGCLSFPGEELETIRFNHIRITDMLEPEGRVLTGFAAVCAEHEYDHTQGHTMHERRKNQIGANDRCPCDSGKKFKKCCLPNLQAYKEVSNVIRPSDVKKYG